MKRSKSTSNNQAELAYANSRPGVGHFSQKKNVVFVLFCCVEYWNCEPIEKSV